MYYDMEVTNSSNGKSTIIPIYESFDFESQEDELEYVANDIKNIINEARLSGCKWYIVEQDECQGDPFISIETSFNNLLKFVT